ncbi:unnamed protein product [Closterium sp. Naga37s-1]|nr:unnamed protein product [Closterium sp. Naga37s-1]
MPRLYRFGQNRHQPAENTFTRITPDRSFTISCPAGSLARAAKALKAESASVRCDVTADSPENLPDAESANVRFDPRFDGKPVLAAGTEAQLRADGREEGESEGRESEKGESRGGREEVDGRGARTRRETGAREVQGKVDGGGWKRGERGGCKETEEEEKAVAVIAGVLRERFGPQIVTEEEHEGSTNERIADEEKKAKGRQEEEEEDWDEEAEGSEVEEEEDGEGNEGGDAAAEASEEVGLPTTSPPTRPPPPRNRRRVVSPSSLLSLYRFFSSHLGISSPSTVTSLLVSYPSLLRSDPTNDLLPRVQLLQSYGAPSLVHLSSQTLISKLQYLEEVVGKKAAGSVVRSYSSILILSVENLQGKVALLGDLIGQENAVLAVARFPRLLSSSGENLKKGFEELVREVEAAMEESGGEENGRHMLQEGARKLAIGVSGQAYKSIAGATIAHEMVVNMVLKYPAIICFSWERNTRHKVEYLKRDMGLPLTEVLAFPYFLGAGVVHEAESATLRFEPSFDDEPVLPVGSEARLRAGGRDEGESEGGKSEKRGSRVTRIREVEGKVAGGGWKRGERGGCKETEEEEKAVAVIAGVLREKFGPQIVTEEEYEGSTNERITEEEDAKGRQGEEEVGYGDEERGGVEAEGEEGEGWKEGEDSEPEAELEAEAEASEEDAPPTTSPPKRHPPPYYGPREMLDFLLARGVRRTRLGPVLRKSRKLISVRARSTNLDILVERAGVPVDKLGVIIDRAPDILSVREETIRSRLEEVSAYFTKSGEGSVNSGRLRQYPNRQHKDKNDLSGLLVQYPGILLRPPERIASNLRLLQSFTPPGTPSIAIPVLRRAPTLVHRSSQNLLPKLQFFVELVGKKAAGSVVRSFPMILFLSVENVQGKVALLSDLIGRENAVLAVARFPRILGSNEENLKKGFKELVREVEAEMEDSGGEDMRRQILEEDARKLAGGGSGQAFKSIAGATIVYEMVANLVVKFPTSICCSWEENMRHKVEYLKRDMGLSIKEVLAFPKFLGYAALERKGAVGQQGVNQQQEGKAVVCLIQFLGCTDKEFEHRFKVELAPFMPETRP